jgi:integrase
MSWSTSGSISADGAGRSGTAASRTRREAEVARAKLVDELHSGTYVSPTRTTLSQWAIDSWLPMIATQIKPSTLHSYRRNLEIRVLPALGAKPLGQITPVMLNTLYASFASPTSERDELSAKTIGYIHTIIHKALSDAVDAELLARNPAARAKPPRRGRRAASGVQAWNPDELAAFLAATAHSRLAGIWRLAAMTGMRSGEILGLRWSDVDLDCSRLSVRQALVAVGYKIIHSTPKSHCARVIDPTPRPPPSFASTDSARTKSGPSGAPTTRTTTSWAPRRTASRSTRTPSANPSSG